MDPIAAYNLTVNLITVTFAPIVLVLAALAATYVKVCEIHALLRKGAA